MQCEAEEVCPWLAKENNLNIYAAKDSENNEKRKMLYQHYIFLVHEALGKHFLIQHPKYVLDVVLGLFPNADDILYMGHKDK